jgi:hypothetical protein
MGIAGSVVVTEELARIRGLAPAPRKKESSFFNREIGGIREGNPEREGVALSRKRCKNLGLTPSLNEPHLLGSGGWGGFPVDSAVDHLAHAVKPPLCSGEPALAAGEAHGCVTETHFQLRVEHKIIPFFLGRILARAVGQMLSMARFYLQPVGLADFMDLR